MSVELITATIGCDECGCQFKVEIDAGWRVGRPFKTMFDVALDACRGGVVHSGTDGCPSVDGERTLCGPCTGLADAAWIADHPTYISGVKAEGGAGRWEVETYEGETVHLIGPKPEFDTDLHAYLAFGGVRA